MHRFLKHMIDARLPQVADLYRHFREESRLASPAARTSFGFTLAGHDAMASGKFESDELSLFQALVATSASCVDVGANVGLYSCLAASLGKHVVAIEPAATNLAFLYRNLHTNGFSEVEVFPVGVSCKPGIRELYGSGTGASFIAGWAQTPRNWSRLVPVSTLDTILGQRFDDIELLIKVDVEGLELDVLNGASRTLALQPSPTWIVEICLDEHHPAGMNRDFSDTFKTFWDRGYEATIADPSRRPVGPEDVGRWVRGGHVDFGSHNYVFSRVRS